MKLRHLLTFYLMCMGAAVPVHGATLTMKQCIDLGIANNLSLRSAETDIQSARVDIERNRNRLLPTLQAFGTFVDNVHRGTSITDGSTMSQLFGVDMPYMKTRGVQFNIQAGVQLSMPLFDRTIYLGNDIAKTMSAIAENNYEATRRELVTQIAQLYYLIQTTRLQIGLTDENIHRLQRLDSIAMAFQENGMSLKVDAQRVHISLSNQRLQLENAQAVLEQQYNMLRYVLGVSPDFELEIEPLDADAITSRHHDFRGVTADLPELQALNLQKQLIDQQKRQTKASYLPKVSLVGNLSWLNATNRFANYFKSDPSDHWYNSTYWGVSVSIPLFDGLNRRTSIKKLDISRQKIGIAQDNLQKRLDTGYANALCDWDNTSRNLRLTRDNYQLAEQVYNVTTYQYREGIAPLTSLLQDEMSMTAAQSAYINAVLSYLNAELTLLKLTGQLHLLAQ